MGKIGMVGLGRMGFDMSQRLLKKGHKVIAYNRSPDKVREIAKKGASAAFSIEELVGKLGDGKDRRIVWLMLPAGEVTEKMIRKLLGLLKKGDVIVDGANAFYKEAEKHGKLCEKKGILFFDCGVSGGTHGLERGYTLMIGGSKKAFKYIEPFCRSLSPKKGYGYFGETGKGHYVKSVHNIVEYVYLQGLAEGVELLDKRNIDLKKATEVWGPASVINSWLLDLTNTALKKPDFKKIGTKIDSVTISELMKTKNSVKGFTPAFDSSVKVRKSKGKEEKKFKLGKKTIAAVRREFGGHKVRK
jgi:6-phosphogluconate dehydrogenase